MEFHGLEAADTIHKRIGRICERSASEKAADRRQRYGGDSSGCAAAMGDRRKDLNSILLISDRTAERLPLGHK